MNEILQGLYITLIILLALHASQYWALVVFCPKNKTKDVDKADIGPLIHDGSLPKVTVQIPVFNERYMVGRIINAVANFDYPSELLQIQVLDDSTDDTPEIAQVEVEKFQKQGIDIVLIHRDNREGFKAGALVEGLKSAKGEYIALFDADFVPHANFLRRLIVDRNGFEDPKTAFLQTRWVYLNRYLNKMTEAQGQMLDSHFYIDQVTRSQYDLPFNFNGSGGIWRKKAIEDAGGWELDTLTEDLDLSFRAKMKGWHGKYFIEEEAPNDLPADILAFKQQQRRWARGNAQCFRKLIFKILTSKLSFIQKLSSFFHMVGYFVCGFMMTFIIIFPVLSMQPRLIEAIPFWVHIMGTFCMSYFLVIFVANLKRGGNVKQFFSTFGYTILMMIGVSVSNSIAVAQGLFRKQVGVFDRTPKEKIIASSSGEKNHGLEENSNNLDLNTNKTFQITSGYRLKPDSTMWVEMGVAVYSLTMAVVILNNDRWVFSIPMLIYGAVFTFFSSIQIWDIIRPKNNIAIPEADVFETLAKNDVTSPAE